MNDAERRATKARERQQRRRQRKQTQEQRTVSTARSSRPKQIAPAEKPRERPQLDLRFLRPILLGVGALLFMVVLILAVGMFKDDPVIPDANALWIGPEWTYIPVDDDAIRDFAGQLRAHEIGAVYAHISELNVDNSWTGRVDGQNRFSEVEREVTDFAAAFRRAYPDAQLFGTLSIRTDLDDDSYRLDDEEVQAVITSMSSRVVTSLGYDGVLLNVEPVWDGDANLLELLRRVRRAIGDNKLLAVAIPPDWTPQGVDVPVPSVIAPGTIWDQQYKQRIVLTQVDQIVLRSYNSYLTRSDEYADWMAYQVQTLSEAVAAIEDTGVDVLIGLPTYRNDLPAHDVNVENLVSASVGIRRGLEQLTEETNRIRGVALYANWDMDDDDWQQFRDVWLD